MRVAKITAVGRLICLLMVAIACTAWAGAQNAGPAASEKLKQATECTTPENHQFDFWIGDWDVLDVANSTEVAHVIVTKALDGCVLREQYEDNEGLKGESLSLYDGAGNAWQQSWVTNRGQQLVLRGGLQGDSMVLSGKSNSAAGPVLVRAIWKPAEQVVKETAVRSYDGGKTWKPWFDLLFRRRQPGQATDSADAKVVAALDTEYQAAVEKNDAATMDRILSDDFVLVTGKGKTYTKADLLKDARDAVVHYEHQTDSEKTVRVWGDTAMVTAKLFAKGTENGEPFEYELWFSDTYLRTPTGWRYVFAQAAQRLPKTQ